MNPRYLAMPLLCLCLAGTAACDQKTSIASQSMQAKRNMLEDISGVWRTGGNELITINISDGRLQMLVDDVFLPVQVGNTDDANGTINLKLRQIDGSDAIWTLRKVKEGISNGNAFHLVLIAHDGTASEFGFVRTISTDDLNRIASLSKRQTPQASVLASILGASGSATTESSESTQFADSAQFAESLQSAAEAAAGAADTPATGQSIKQDMGKPVDLQATINCNAASGAPFCELSLSEDQATRLLGSKYADELGGVYFSNENAAHQLLGFTGKTLSAASTNKCGYTAVATVQVKKDRVEAGEDGWNAYLELVAVAANSGFTVEAASGVPLGEWQRLRGFDECKTGAASGSLPPVIGSVKASFDCAKAYTRSERLICADAALASMDKVLAEVYSNILKNASSPGFNINAYKREQRTWLKTVRDACPDAGCLRQAYEERRSGLIESYGAGG